MKRLIATALVFFISAQIFSQSCIETELQRMIRTQVFDEAEKTVPLIIPLPGMFIYGSHTYFDSEIYFSAKSKDEQASLGFSAIREYEIRNNLPLIFSSGAYPGSFRLNAFEGDNLAVSCSVRKSDSITEISMMNADGSYRREAKFREQELMYQSVTNSRGNYITQYEQLGPAVRKYTYNTLNRNYQVTDDYFTGKQLTTRVIYKSSKTRTKLHEQYKVNFSYDSQNRLTSEKRFTDRNKPVDSVMYLYSGNSVTQIRPYEDNQLIITEITDQKHLLSEKRIELPGSRIRINYTYDELSQLTGLEIADESRNQKTRYSFAYTPGSRLAEMDAYDFDASVNSWNMEEKFVFTYKADNYLDSITRIEPNGHVSKRLHYDFSLL